MGRPRPQPKRLESPRPTGSNSCWRGADQRPNVRLCKESVGEAYHAPILSLHPSSNGLVRFKESKRWYISSYARRMFNIPFIDHCGRIHNTSVAHWYCEPEQLFASMVATVNKRLVGRYRQKFIPKYRPKSDLLFQVSLLYVITKDSSKFLRMQCMLARRRYTQLRKFCCFVKHRLDDNKRFLYDQAFNSASWFQHRARRPCGRKVTRDKSRLDDCVSRSQHKRWLATERVLTSDSRRWSDSFASGHRLKTSMTIDPPFWGKGSSFFGGHLHTK